MSEERAPLVDDGPVQQIVIVGGGTAGWLTAVFLDRALNAAGRAPCSITLIESSDIGTIGVGEATVPSIKNTFRFCGIDEDAWMRACNASFKLAIRFAGWRDAGGNDVYWHPFGPLPDVDGVPLSQFWHQRHLRGELGSYDKTCFRAVHLCEAGRAPKAAGERPYEGQVEYAYHLDAGLLATYLRQLGKSRGVRHVVDTVSTVAQAQDGSIGHLVTKQHGTLAGDLFIDCSGFSGLLINQTLGEPFISFSDVLLCDSAIAMPIPTDDKRFGIEPYTTARALTGGWAWRTPLYGRSGNGYVYSSPFLDRDCAETEFCHHLGPPSEGVEARHLRMRVGMTRNAWVKNCVSIGLSSGFIEPLESTGIWFIEMALYHLLYHFPTKRCDESVSAHYNGLMKKHYEQVRDFIVLHYLTTDRLDTPFWKANRENTAVPETLQPRLALWRSILPSHDRLADPGFFKDLSFVAILAGMRKLPKRSFSLLQHRDEDKAMQLFGQIQTAGERLTAELPDHYTYLTQLHD